MPITIEESRKLLEQRYWKTEDVMSYFGVCRRTANVIKHKAMTEFGGKSYTRTEVKAAAVIKAAGRDINQERAEVGLPALCEASYA